MCCLRRPGGMPPKKILGPLRLISKWSVWGTQGEASLRNPSRMNCASERSPLTHILTQFTCFAHLVITDGFNTRHHAMYYAPSLHTNTGSQVVLWKPERRVGRVLCSTPPGFLDGPRLLPWACSKESRGGER